MRAKLSLKGMEEYLETIAKAGGDVDAACADALKAGAEVAVDGMRRRVAVDTGNLKDSLRVSDVQQDGNTISVEMGLLSGTEAATARYGNAQEFGSSSMPAHPYIRPTMAEDKNKITTAMKQSLQENGFVDP